MKSIILCYCYYMRLLKFALFLMFAGCQSTSTTFVDDGTVDGVPVSNYSDADVCMGAIVNRLTDALFLDSDSANYRKVMRHEASRRGLSESDCNDLILKLAIEREKKRNWEIYCYNAETKSSYPSSKPNCDMGYVNVTKDQYEDLRSSGR